MNNNGTRHHFTYDSETDGGDLKTKGVPRASRNTAKKLSSGEERGFRSTVSQGKSTGEYMKPTVNADLKSQPTIAKTKQLVSEHEKKFKEEHTFKPAIKDYALPPSKELSKEARWKKLTEPKTTQLQHRERIRAQLEIEETQKNCTFHP